MALRLETTRRIGKTWRIAVWLVGSLLIVGVASRPLRIDAQESTSRSASPISSHRETIRQYCETCHNTALKTGGLVLNTLDLGNVGHDAEVWERVVRKLRAGAMPPYGARRPDEATMTRLIGWLEGELDRAGSSQPVPGRPVLRRLNRAEYANAIRDLLGIDVNVAALLPPDDAAFGFDNVADAQSSSPALLQAYLAAARKISAVAIGDPAMELGSDTYSVRQDLSQDVYLEGLPLGTVGGLRVTHSFPVDAEYDFQVRLYRTNLNAIRGLEDPQEVELMLDGTRIHTAQIGGDKDLMAAQLNPTDTSDAIEATRLRVRLFVTAGQHDVAAAFLEKTSPTFETHRLRRFIRDFANPYDAEGAPHVQSITIQGPYQTKGVSEAVSSRLFVCRPPGDKEQAACARRIVSTLARRAYRRPPASSEIDVLMSFYERGRSRGSFEDGIRLALRRTLASPSFVYRPEAEPRRAARGTVYPITDLELATRLSFFLWSSIPDEDLLRLGESGQLSKQGALGAQVRRLLSDPKAEAFVNNFAGQWLQLRNLRGLIPNSDMFPDFDDNLREAFEQEAELFFKSIIDEDRSVLDLMTADYTFVNDRLARHYGIPNIVGGYFRRVTLTEDVRRGLLGKGAVLMVTSHANTTSPVLRGKWVLENILGAPPPSPPADLDTALKDEGPDAPPRTMREQMELHRRSPLCATCHRVMDPIGFALENFDVVGAWRTKNEAGLPLNTADALVDGTKITDAVTLRTALLKHPDVFVQTFTEKLLVYALGRGLTPEDMPGVRAIVHRAGENGYRFSSIVEGIVNSAPFRMRMKSNADAPGALVASRR